MEFPSYLEDDVSQVPALQLLINMGWKYLSPEEALALRGGKRKKVILEEVLRTQLKKFNRISYKGQEYPFSETNIENAIRELRDLHFEGTIKTNENAYDLITVGKSFEQTIEGTARSYDLNYIDWTKDPLNNNVFHVTEEFSVERAGSHETRRPDLVLFINGIPVVVIECKRPDLKKGPIELAIKQNLRNQKSDEIPHLFYYTQLLMGLCTNKALYGTTGTIRKYWMAWKSDVDEAKLNTLINQPLEDEVKDRLFNHTYRPHAEQKRKYFDELGTRLATEQDRTILGLLDREQLLDYMFRSVVFDAGIKKVARYNQDRLVEKVLERIHERDDEGHRRGGVVWHTQGSGKSISMVLIAKAISLDERIDNARIILVTDRTDLDDQLRDNFKNCGLEIEQAKTGSHLFELIESNKKQVILTIINKFKAALKRRKLKDESDNIFVLIDESHRTQHGTLHAGMRKVLPNACYLGFTGTPLVKKEKNDIDLFGGFIDTYTIDDARRDEVVCDLIYEGRYVEQNVNQKVIDQWFERITRNLTDAQKEDLKRKFSTRDHINQTDQRLMLIAYDINDHFTKRENLLFKGQIIATSKASAIKYKRFLDQIGDISSEVVISPPEALEGHEDLGEDKKLVQDFWKDQMDKYGTAESYQETIINSYKKGERPEIIIVVNKLITGFDAPQNTYLYIDRKFQEPHSVLQAIARVNRLYPGKEFGYLIDYAGVYGEIDDAKKLYAELLESFDEDDIQNSFADIKDEIDKLPQRHSNVKGIFKGIETRDIEAYEQLLADEETRDRFFDRLSTFNRTYRMAMNSVQFEIDTDDETLERYRLDHKFFNNLRRSVQNRYNLTVDLAEFDPQMKRILDTNVDAIKVEQIIPPTNIFEVKYEERKAEFETPRAKADFITSALEKTISENYEDDPEFYRPLSNLLQDLIKIIREQRFDEAKTLQMALELENKVKRRTGDELPEKLEKREPVVKAYYGFAFKHLKDFHTDEFSPKEVSADVAIKIDDIILEKRIRDWTDNQDVKNQMLNEIEDFLFDLKARHEIDLSLDAIDDIMSESMKVAERRRAI